MPTFTTSLLSLSLSLLSITSTTLAAECFSQTGASNCASRNGLYTMREAYCKDFWQYPGIAWQGADGSNVAQLTHTTIFGAQQDCWDAYENIIVECLGKANGGSWTKDANTAVMDFCITAK